MCKGMLNGEAGVREVKEATTDFTSIPQTGPRNSLLPSQYLLFFFILFYFIFLQFFLHSVTNCNYSYIVTCICM